MKTTTMMKTMIMTTTTMIITMMMTPIMIYKLLSLYSVFSIRIELPLFYHMSAFRMNCVHQNSRCGTIKVLPRLKTVDANHGTNFAPLRNRG